MQMSIHLARWIKSIEDSGWDLHLFPVNHLPEIEGLRGVTIHRPLARVRLPFLQKILDRNSTKLRQLGNRSSQTEPSRCAIKPILPMPFLAELEPYVDRIFRIRLGESRSAAPFLYGPHLLARLIRQLRPDLIHSMEFQHAGYRVLQAKELLGEDFPAWLATNWGSDIYYYRHFEGHLQQIQRLLRNIDYYSCECQRDVRLARELGLKGKVMAVFPNSGGIDLSQADEFRSRIRPSMRRLIVLKGYQHFAGRAMTALEALEECTDALQNFDVVLFSASPEVARRARKLTHKGTLNAWIAEHLPHDQMLRLQSRARVYLAVSISDAISTSLLEAIAMGAFPIQTNTSCCDEWITDGESGFIVDPDDVGGIAECVRMAVTDDKLVDRAAELNWATVQKRLDQREVARQVHDLYERIFEDLSRG
jgi:glycosyltransferase involved in cell wall biosynthesis